MSDFIRFAIYYLPENDRLGDWGAAWLGWDVRHGQPVPQPDLPGLAQMTATPRRYGMHATLKPPFTLADGRDAAGLDAALRAFAARQPAVVLDGLQISAIGRFLALTPQGDTTALSALAAACVQEFDAFRAPAGAADLTRRRAAGLTPAQDAHLRTWGYPYVLDQFRFHITLTGALDDAQLDLAQTHLQNLPPPLPQPFVIGRIALAGQRPDGLFQAIHSYTLAG